MNQIVVGFGTHEHSTKALEWAAAIARRTGSNVAVLNVYHPAFAEHSPDVYYRLQQEQQEHIHEIMARCGHAEFDVVVCDGEPAHELERYAARTKADLIVVGHHGTAAPGGFGEHGPAEHLLRTSTTPFVVVRPDATIPSSDHQFTIVVGVDGSEANAESVSAIATLATELDAKTVPVLSVNTGASTSRAQYNDYGAHLLHQEEAERIAASLPDHSAIETPNRNPVDGLLLIADDLSADLIAIGTRGHRGIRDLFAGQIGRHLIARSHRPVMIAPHK